MNRKCRILAIDDEEPIRMLYERALGSAGYDVTLAQDGFEALKILQSESFDAILVDIVMPELDGVEAITVMKSACVPTPIIVVTGHAREEAVEFARQAGAGWVVYKPFRVSDLLESIEEAILHPEGLYPDYRSVSPR